AAPSGTATCSVGDAVPANAGAPPGTETMSIDGQTVTVTQAGVRPPCTFTLSPTSASPAAAASTGSVGVIASAMTCTWSATSNATWITVTSGASGTGNGSVGYSVAANTGTTSRTGSMTIAGETFTVHQGGARPQCD